MSRMRIGFTLLGLVLLSVTVLPIVVFINIHGWEGALGYIVGALLVFLMAVVGIYLILSDQKRINKKSEGPADAW